MSVKTKPWHLTRRTVLASSMAGAAPAVWAQSASAKPDAAKYFAPAQVTGAELSPDGQRLALRSRGPHGRAMLAVIELDGMKPTVVYSSDGADASHFVWVNNQRLAFTLGDWETPTGKQDSGPGLFGVNADGSAFKQLVERQHASYRNGNDGRELLRGNIHLLNGVTQRSGDEVFVAQPEQWQDNEVDYIKLLKLNTLNGRTTEIDGPLHAVGWWADNKGELRAALVREKEKGSLMWKDPAGGAWRTLSEFNVFTDDGDLNVHHIAADGRLYVSARRGNDKRAMWIMDPATGKWSDKPLASSPGFDVDAYVVARKDKVLGLRFTIDAEVTQWFDADMQALQAAIDKVLPRTSNRLSVPWDGDAPWVLIEAFADIQPSLYYLFNRATKKFTRLGGARPDIDPKQMAAMDLVHIQARDGKDVPTWVTMPPGQEKGKNLPMVVLVHGGPFMPGQHWHFNAEVQFLAARGYVVIQPEFRGTLGYGTEHAKGGWRQWGKSMQDDVTDATRWAMAQGLADPKRIAIAGASYGGYATLMGLVREPGLYRCGVCWVGVTDLDMLHTVTWDDMPASYKKFGMPKLLGDRVKDADDLKANSPLTHAAKITQPMLLAYGGKDRRVPIVHGEKFKKAVQATNPNVEWVVYDDEGHGWADPANKLDFYGRMARFLDRYTGPV